MSPRSVIAGLDQAMNPSSQKSHQEDEPAGQARGQPAGWNGCRSAFRSAPCKLPSSIIISLPLAPGRRHLGPAVVRVRAAKSTVAGNHLRHALFEGSHAAIINE